MNNEEILNKLNQVQTLINEVVDSLQPDQSDQPNQPQEVAVVGDIEESHESSVGLTGVFNGEFVMMENGKKYQVPPNYASKSMLVEGDRLKLMKEGDFNEFKLMGQIERVEVEGILTKKDNQWVALVEDSSSDSSSSSSSGTHEYRLVSAAIRYYNGEIGDKLVILLPKGYEQNSTSWAAVKELNKSEENARKQKEDAERVGVEEQTQNQVQDKKKPSRDEGKTPQVNPEAAQPSDSKTASGPSSKVIDNVPQKSKVDEVLHQDQIQDRIEEGSEEVDLDGIPDLR